MIPDPERTEPGFRHLLLSRCPRCLIPLLMYSMVG